MKNFLILLLAIAFVSLNMSAQTEDPVATRTDERRELKASGLMTKWFIKKKHSSSDLFSPRRRRYSQTLYKFDSFNFSEANYDSEARSWRLVGQISDSAKGKTAPMWIIYQEWNGLLKISLHRENNVMWTIPKKNEMKVTIAEDRSSFKLEFLKNFEGKGRAGSDHFWLKDSWFLAELN